MKAAFLLIYRIVLALTFLCVISIKANPIPNDMPDGVRYRALNLYYENSGGEKALSTYEYDETGKLRAAVWEQLDKSRNSLNRYEYDNEGNLIAKYREYSDRIFSKESYEYDKNGNLIRETFERSDGAAGVTIHEYNDNGCLMKSNCDKYKGWIKGEISYTCDERNRRISASLLNDGDSIAVIDYTYDSDGNLIREHWDFGGEWNQTFIYTYGIFGTVAPGQFTSANVLIRNNGGYRVSGENYEYSDGSGGPSKYEYDKSGKLIRKRYDHSNGLYTKTTFLYDFDGRLTKSYRLYSSGLSGVFTYEFNDMGKLTQRTFVRSDGKTAQEIYNYDDDGKLVSGKLKNFDNWLSGELSFLYDNSNKLEKAIFKGDKNFDADILFEYDNNNNLIKYTWNFSFGDSQTYNFDYEKIKI